MRSKSPERMQDIIAYIEETYAKCGAIPTMQNIADNLGMSKSGVSKYVAEMRERGMLEQSGSFRNVKTAAMRKHGGEIEYIPIVGSIACGTPMFAEENIETYIPFPKEVLGIGEYFVLRAYGDSMIGAGIEDGDLVIVRKQETAEEGQIVVALIESEATLKRLYYDEKRHKIRLRPENDAMEDMLFDEVAIQGVAVKVLKDL